jgi:hypothetical protein
MISLPHPVRVFLHAPPTDLRKGFDALSGLVTIEPQVAKFVRPERAASSRSTVT